MIVFFRVDSSTAMGIGHVMRCLTLAEAIRSRGGTATFVCRPHSGNLCGYIRQRGFIVRELTTESEPKLQSEGEYSSWLGSSWEQDARETKAIMSKCDKEIDWIVIDHYALDIRWEKEVGIYSKRMLVIDDLAQRSHWCDLILDQNLYPAQDKRYFTLIPEKCRKLLGPQYALLRPEFMKQRETCKPRKVVKRIFLFFGGSDPTNETYKGLEALKTTSATGITVDVVVGQANPFKNSIESMCNSLKNTNFYCQTQNMAELMASADLAIGAGGTTTWERCCLGLPAIVVSVAKNQEGIAAACEEKGIVRYLGPSEKVSLGEMSRAIADMLTKPLSLKEMSERCFATVDGKGADRVVSIMEQIGEVS